MKAKTLVEFFQRFPVIYLNDDLIMRQMLPKDAARYLEIYQDDEVTRYLSNSDVPTNLAEAVDAVTFWGNTFNTKRSIYWTIARKSDDIMVGNIGYTGFSMPERRAEISYDLDKNLWGKGIMKKAAQAALNVAFNEMHVYRVEARTMLHNDRSQNLLKRLHFQKEGILRGYRIIRGKPEDITIYSLLKGEYQNH